MVLGVHAKKRDDDNGGGASALEAKLAPTILPRKRGVIGSSSDGSLLSRDHRRKGRMSFVGNFAFAAALFWALIQVFDPLSSPTTSSSSSSNPSRKQTISPVTVSSNGGNTGFGRERIRTLLEKSGIMKVLTKEQFNSLPKWEHVVQLYGNDVIIVGKEDCAAFCARVPKDQRALAVAGLFNTGTNLLDAQMRKNVQILPPPSPKNLWQVPWGKHRMAVNKYNHTAPDMEDNIKENVLPVVIIRDPFSWLQSMCKHAYAANWRHHSHHCPNLVPNEEDLERFKDIASDLSAFPVSINFDKKFYSHFDSLVHLWSEWYTQYLNVDYPVLFVRYEDLVFQPDTVLAEIAHCVEGTLHSPFFYQLATSKNHGSGTDYIKALTKTADAKGRHNNMTAADLKYATRYLDEHLMKTFGYNVPELPTV